MAKARKANENKIREIKEIINSRPESYVVFDIETTGFEYAAGHKIIEIGAVKYSRHGEDYIESGAFSRLINPETYKVDENGNLTNEIMIHKRITELTGITPEMVQNEKNYQEILPEFHEFIKDSVLVAHNAAFDTNFTRFYFEKLGLSMTNSVVDTLEMARDQLKELTSHKLNVVCDYFGIVQENHHRAVEDCRVTGEIFLKLMPHYLESQVNIFSGLFLEEAEEVSDSEEQLDISIESVAYWAKGGKERIYINTDKGSIYYDLLAEEIGMDPWQIEKLNMPSKTFEKLLLDFMGMESIEQFSNFRGKKHKQTVA